MPKALPGIDYSGGQSNPVIDADTSLFLIPLYKDSEYFSSLENFVQFAKAVETLVRKSKRYKQYKAYIMNEIGIKRCQVLGNIEVEEDDNTLIDMHHGPMLTLFDYVTIVIDHYLAVDKKITTFRIADVILNEHFANRVRVMMCSQTVHELIHDGAIFANLRQGFGDVCAFLKKYEHGVGDDHITKINNYINLSEKYDSFDKDVLKLKDTIADWSDK